MNYHRLLITPARLMILVALCLFTVVSFVKLSEDTGFIGKPGLAGSWQAGLILAIPMLGGYLLRVRR
jgi:hypothetical protein